MGGVMEGQSHDEEVLSDDEGTSTVTKKAKTEGDDVDLALVVKVTAEMRLDDNFNETDRAVDKPALEKITTIPTQDSGGGISKQSEESAFPQRCQDVVVLKNIQERSSDPLEVKSHDLHGGPDIAGRQGGDPDGSNESQAGDQGEDRDRGHQTNKDPHHHSYNNEGHNKEGPSGSGEKQDQEKDEGRSENAGSGAISGPIALDGSLDICSNKGDCGASASTNAGSGTGTGTSSFINTGGAGGVCLSSFAGGELKVPWQWTDQMTLREYRGTQTILSPEEVQRQRQRLPIHQYREQLINAVRFNQVVVVVGETASGKSTQMPQYILEAGLISGGSNGSCEGGRIAITQPRRVAAVSLASRVAQERACAVSDTVGYAIRFEDMAGPRTLIKYMTDGLLVMECLRDPTFAAYGCIILDEAHERTLHTDILLGLLKKATRLRPELKVVITSATLDIKKFADYFGAPMIKIPGKNFPVTLKYLYSHHSNMDHNNNTDGGTRFRGSGIDPLWIRARRTDAYLGMAVERVLSIHTAELGRPGDILLFLPGKEEVESACERLHRTAPDLMPLPVYAALPFEAQCVIFNSAPPGVRKVIVATNIAETSITIDGVRFVIDTGLFKECTYDHGIDTLRVTAISKAQANQRAGRAGRTAPGICHRLYTVEDFDRMKEVPSPAIHRADFTSTALQLKAMGIDDICGFGFMDPPKRGRVNQALYRLGVIGALDRFGKVTPMGFKMAEFPLLPNLSKILLTAAEMSCSDEVLTIVSMLSSKYVFVRPRKRTAEADAAKKKFLDPLGDHLTLLNVFNAWKTNGMSEDWSKANFVHQKEMERAAEIRGQLQALMTLHEVPVVSAGRYLSNIRKALSTGEPNNVACRDHWYRDGKRGSGPAYRTYIDHQLVFIHPSSALYKSSLEPELVIYHETITTTRNFMRTVSVCERSWLPKLLSKAV